MFHVKHAGSSAIPEQDFSEIVARRGQARAGLQLNLGDVAFQPVEETDKHRQG